MVSAIRESMCAMVQPLINIGGPETQGNIMTVGFLARVALNLYAATSYAKTRKLSVTPLAVGVASIAISMLFALSCDSPMQKMDMDPNEFGRNYPWA